jgi:hypothetical protein
MIRPHAVILALALAAASSSSSLAERPTMTKDQATLVVQGEVESIYRRVQQDSTDYMIFIRVETVEKGDAKPGQLVHAFCYQAVLPPGIPGAKGHSAIPKEGDEIRAYLWLRDIDHLEGIYPDWYEPISSPWALGVYITPIHVVDKGNGLQITQLVPGGAAERAGLRPGDILFYANDRGTMEVRNLTKALAHSDGKVKLKYLERATGRDKDVEVNMTKAQGRPPG